MKGPLTCLLLFFNLVLMVSCHQKDRSYAHKTTQDSVQARYLVDGYGAIIRGNRTKKAMTLVFTGDEYADGGEIVREILKRNKVSAAFFFTGNFYSRPDFEPLIIKLKEEGHYLGAHSDQHLLYADWDNRDSLLVTREEFLQDLQDNYTHMAKFGIEKEDALYFLPPFEWYNREIVKWTDEAGLQLINFSPGTLSTADYTFPQMGDRYRSSDEIYQSILLQERADPNGLNGFILLIHIGTDPRRTDKFYDRLDGLIKALKTDGYRFVPIGDLLGKG